MGGDGRRDGTIDCVAMGMIGEEGGNKSNTRLNHTPGES